MGWFAQTSVRRLASSGRSGIALASSGRGGIALASSGRGGIGLASSGRGGIGLASTGLASTGRGGIGLASSGRGGIGLASYARGGIGLASYPRGGMGLASYARGGIGLASSTRGGIGLAPPPRGGTGSFPFSLRGLSSSSFKWDSWASYKAFVPAKDTMKLCGLIGGFSGVMYTVSSGYGWLLEQSVLTAKQYVDTKLEDFKAFKNIAIGAHQDFVHTYNQDNHQTQQEIAELKSQILALQQKEFEHRKALLVAADILNKHQAEQGAAAAKDPSQ